MKALVSAVLCCVLTFCAVGATTPVSAQTVAWKMAHQLPADTPEGRVLQRFADTVKEYSQGRMTIQIYPAGQLGQQAAALEQTQLGTIQMYVDAAFFLQRWAPDLRWLSASFLFENKNHWERFVHSPLVKSWFDKVEKDAGIITLGNLTDFARGPYRVLVSKKPINAIADLQGLKLRMYPDQLATAVWNNLGVETRQMAMTEAYFGIKNGVVDSVTTPVSLVQAMRFYEVAPYVVRTDEYWQELAFMTNAKAYQALPIDLRDALLRAHKDVGAYNDKLMSSVTAELTEALSKQGVTFVTLDVVGLIKKTKELYDSEAKAGRVPAGFFEAVDSARKG